MRYIGNKTKLLDFIGSVLDTHSICKGRAFDAFSGTASVGRYLKKRGFHVTSCDLMSYSYAFQSAYIETDRVPKFREVIQRDHELSQLSAEAAFRQYTNERYGSQGDLFGGPQSEYDGFVQVASYLEAFLTPQAGFITANYSPTENKTSLSRMFFTSSNAQRIDAIRAKIHEWRCNALLDETEYFILLACLIEAADAVANTTGVYAAFIKSWQPNALRPLRLERPDLVTNTGLVCEAMQADVNQVIGDVRNLTLLYLDPPYNTRQYSAYYHVPQIIADGWYDKAPELRGKSGLIDDSDKKSQWSTRAGCVGELEKLLQNTDARHVLLSYNSEGIIPEEEIRRVFRKYGDPSSYRRFEFEYARYRSDSDHARRRYSSDVVTERIYYIARTS